MHPIHYKKQTQTKSSSFIQKESDTCYVASQLQPQVLGHSLNHYVKKNHSSKNDRDKV